MPSSVKRRLRLFDSTVGSCVLWCAQSWTLRVDEQRLLRSARRAMLRRIVSSPRSPDEDYITFIRRTTHRAEALAKSAHVRDWCEAHSLLKWSWAGHVARRGPNSWTWRTTVWRDSEWQELAMECGTARPLRPSRRRWMKWEDSLRRFCAYSGSGSWKMVASNRQMWADMAADFSKWCR